MSSAAATPTYTPSVPPRRPGLVTFAVVYSFVIAGFYVLVGAEMPSVLFETSYISNVTEEQRLGRDDYRQVLADAITNAVKAYREGR